MTQTPRPGPARLIADPWVLAALVVAYLALGAGWYTVFADPWLTAVGRTAEELGEPNPAIYLLPAAAAVAYGYLVAVVLDRRPGVGAVDGLAAGALVWACAVLPFAAVHHALGGFSPMLTVIDGGMELVGLAVTGLVLSWGHRRAAATVVSRRAEEARP